MQDLEVPISQKFHVVSHDFNSYCIKNFLSIKIANASKAVSIDHLKVAYVDPVKRPETWNRLRKCGRLRNNRDC